MTNIINSLKRLERLGQENSRTTLKAKEASKTVAIEICSQLNTVLKDRADRISSEQGYYLRKITGKFYYYMEQNCYARMSFDVDGGMQEYNLTEYSLQRDHAEKIGRDVALGFAKAVAEGLLDDVNDFIEKELEKAKNAIVELENRK